jgi:hypothetical protein
MQDVSVATANQLNCSCKPACDETIFDVSISMAQWPSSQYMNVMALNPINNSLPQHYQYDPVNCDAESSQFQSNASKLLKSQLQNLFIFIFFDDDPPSHR